MRQGHNPMNDIRFVILFDWRLHRRESSSRGIVMAQRESELSKDARG
jgi:hypothetical protein